MRRVPLLEGRKEEEFWRPKLGEGREGEEFLEGRVGEGQAAPWGACSGFPHQKPAISLFMVEERVNENPLRKGEGRTRKAAAVRTREEVKSKVAFKGGGIQ